MSTSSLPSFIKIHPAVLEKKSKMWKVYGRTTTTDDGRCAMTIAHSSLRLRWAKNPQEFPCFQYKNLIGTYPRPGVWVQLNSDIFNKVIWVLFLRRGNICEEGNIAKKKTHKNFHVFSLWIVSVRTLDQGCGSSWTLTSCHVLPMSRSMLQISWQPWLKSVSTTSLPMLRP